MRSTQLGISGAFTVVLMSAINFALASDFRWVLLIPALLWLAALVFYGAGTSQQRVPHDQ